MPLRDVGEGIAMLLFYTVATVLSVSFSVLAFGLFVRFALWFTRLVLGW